MNTKFPGSVHDSAVLATSSARKILKDMYDDGNHSTWLLGDQGYPLEPWLMTPAAVTVLESPEAKFNMAFR